jgi:hypothetical protein
MLVKLLDVRRAIEVGVFTGYSALTTTLAVHEEGRLLACEISEDFVPVGKPFWQQAGVVHEIDLQLAPASETLDARLAAGAAGSDDFAFIDDGLPDPSASQGAQVGPKADPARIETQYIIMQVTRERDHLLQQQSGRATTAT